VWRKYFSILAKKILIRSESASTNCARAFRRGRSSVVERHLAKVDVVSSNLIARSIFQPLNPLGIKGFFVSVLFDEVCTVRAR
jgi:hypothetical protein